MQAFFDNLGQWLQSLPVVSQMAMTGLISMVPVIELRGAIPVAAVSGLSWPLAYLSAVIGNMLPVPFIIVFIRRIFLWLKDRNRFAAMVYRLEERAMRRAAKMHHIELLGLFLFVAVPLPGTGAWTGALIAALLNIEFKRALTTILLGVLTAGAIVCAMSYSLVSVFAG